MLDGFSKCAILSSVRDTQSRAERTNMKKFLVKFVDALTGRTAEKTVKADTEEGVRLGCDSKLQKVISIVLL